LAKKYGFSLYYPKTIKNPQIINQIQNANPDVIFEFGTSQIIPEAILEVPKFGCIGSHGGPLQYYKGAATYPPHMQIFLIEDLNS